VDHKPEDNCVLLANYIPGDAVVNAYKVEVAVCVCGGGGSGREFQQVL
jgi:hypothetical protein